MVHHDDGDRNGFVASKKLPVSSILVTSVQLYNVHLLLSSLHFSEHNLHFILDFFSQQDQGNVFGRHAVVLLGLLLDGAFVNPLISALHNWNPLGYGYLCFMDYQCHDFLGYFKRDHLSSALER